MTGIPTWAGDYDADDLQLVKAGCDLSLSHEDGVPDE